MNGSELRSGPGLRFSIREGLCMEHAPDPCGLVVFGASGDLAGRKLFPALNGLRERKLLPKGFFVLGVSRTPIDPARFGGLSPVEHLQGDYTAAETYQRLKVLLQRLANRHDTQGNVIFYLAVPPALYTSITHYLGRAGLLEQGWGGWARLAIEKPFGRDLASAAALGVELCCHIQEPRVYRMDHYLGKETVQNVLMFRFANSIFEPVWNRAYIDHVQISVLESDGVGRRAGYYDSSGVLRDMFQNHMLQLLALVAMEPPASFAAEHVRDEKIKVFRALTPFDERRLVDQAVFGQYLGYREEPGVAAASETPTYAALGLRIENWRWSGVPFYLRSGKSLKKRSAEIAVFFRPVPHSVFQPLLPAHLQPNVLVFRIQPDEGVSLSIEAKKPGPKTCIGTLTMDFDYAEAFAERAPEAYQRLLLDLMLGDQTLFPRQDGLEECWRFVEPLLKGNGKLASYAPGSWGPVESDNMLSVEDRYWREP
ncbi:MAG TPA: glucose-6-phosphate dehydrogenase [Elusimicrobia bacterium]|nr:glucose-6-phosphate dehydrogenase [Elusimicrobiota bacterium]HBT62851.1 glucose-6-phosphate dehydrogenase [Elusimicrobiota bacterium]